VIGQYQGKHLSPLLMIIGIKWPQQVWQEQKLDTSMVHLHHTVSNNPLVALLFPSIVVDAVNPGSDATLSITTDFGPAVGMIKVFSQAKNGFADHV
jgi:hypothetical protein